MDTEVTRQITAEEWEFRQKQTELTNLETELGQKELELATFRGELYNFRLRYLSIIGSRYWELDELEARIAENQATLQPDDQALRQRAKQARTQADESAKNEKSQDRKTEKPKNNFKPTESLKKLYREIAKRIHPDLATNDQERTCFQQLMANANKAYQEGDEIGLQNILHHWKKNTKPEMANDLRAKLGRIIQQINQIRDRLVNIELEMEAIRKSSLYQLKQKVEIAARNGLDLLTEMARVLDQQISSAKYKLTQIKKRGIENIAS